MYKQSWFTENNITEINTFIRQHPFAIVCGVDADGKPVATHLPLLAEERNGILFLMGHVMKKTDHYGAYKTNPSVLTIFSGAHNYISASWYTDPAVASTWNYMTVHAKGNIRFLDDAALYEILERTTAYFEKENSPALMKNMSEAYIKSNMKAIAAFEIEVSGIAATFKLSQNKDRKTQENIITELKQLHTPDADAVASEMVKRTGTKNQ